MARRNPLQPLLDAQPVAAKANKRRPPAVADVWAPLVREFAEASEAARAAEKRRKIAAEALKLELRARALAAGAREEDLDAKILPEGHPVRAILESVAVATGAGDVFMTLVDKREYVVEARTDRLLKYRPPVK